MQINFLRGTAVGSCVGGQEWERRFVAPPPPLLCPPAWGQHMCDSSTGNTFETDIFLFISHSRGNKSILFYITVLLELRIGSLRLNEFHLRAIAGCSFFFFFFFRGLPRNQTSPSPSDAALADSSIWTPAAVAQGSARSLSEALS